MTDLDETGATVPDTDYPVPAGAIFMSLSGNDANAGTQSAPVLTINKAVGLVATGGTIVVRAGDYRDWYNSGGQAGVITKTVTIQAYPHETVWFDGADIEPSSGWTSDGSGHWRMNWNTPSFCGGKYYNYPYNAQPTANTGPCSHYDMYYAAAKDSNGNLVTTAAADPQMVFINGTAIHEVDSLGAATPGNFFYDQTNKVIYIATNPSGNTVELASRPTAFQLNGASSKLLGIGFKRYASNEYNNNTEAAVISYSPNGLIENCVFTLNAGAGLGVGNPTGLVINHSVMAFNGFDGAEGNGHESSGGAVDGLVLENSVLNNNNSEGFGYFCSTSCSQAGMKLAHMDGYTARSNIIENNVNAEGLWCDEACTNGVMVYNLVRNNGKAGLFYEVSDTGTIASNLVYGNGSYGISVGSADTRVYNNTLVNNSSGGIWIYDDPRWSGFLEGTQIGPDTVHIDVVNNVISGSGSNAFRAQRSCLVTPPSTGPSSSDFFDLFDYNAYYRAGGSGQVLISWIDTATLGTTCPDYSIPNSTYTSLPSFTSAHPWEGHATDATPGGGDPFFVDQAGGNYNIRSTSTAYGSATSIPTVSAAGFNQTVAEALGVTTTTGLNRGALDWPGRQ